MEAVARKDGTLWIPADREWRRNMAISTGSAALVFPAALLAWLGASLWTTTVIGLVCLVMAVSRTRVAGIGLDAQHRVLTSRGYLVTKRCPYAAITWIGVAGSPQFQGPLTEWGSAALHLTADGDDVVLPSTNTRHRDKALRRAGALHQMLHADTPPTEVPADW
ncbi:hypothetical protein [Luteococcus sanguinis]|uniref:PH domain-containing protein n=1 Tax=Luteococcus sanguinis TaxID=174038 RepID=A0ABW1X0R3_9ACTN